MKEEGMKCHVQVTVQKLRKINRIRLQGNGNDMPKMIGYVYQLFHDTEAAAQLEHKVSVNFQTRSYYSW